jgi:predicted GNAT family acetyltransferase
MRAIHFDDRDEFARRVTPLLMTDEAVNCFFIGILPSLAEKPADTLLLAAEDERGDMVAVALMTPHRHLALTAGPPAAIDAIVDFLIDHKIHPPGVQTRPEFARRFSHRYCARTGAVERISLAMAIHKLSRVKPVHGVAGSMRMAGPDDVEWFATWVLAFGRETGDQTPGDYLEIARARIARQNAFAWEVDGKPVSTASLSGPTPNGVRISLVYTPPPNRGRGYASACVAALSQRMLDAGKKFCFLYTDLANPTSNKIYAAIGYEKVCEDQQIFFGA